MKLFSKGCSGSQWCRVCFEKILSENKLPTVFIIVLFIYVFIVVSLFYVSSLLSVLMSGALITVTMALTEDGSTSEVFCIEKWCFLVQTAEEFTYAWTVSLSSRASLSSLFSSCSFSWASITLSARSRSRSLLRGLGKDGFTT